MYEEIKTYLLEQCRDWMLEEEVKALWRFGLSKEAEIQYRKAPLTSHKIDLDFGFKDEKVNDLVSLGKIKAEESIAKRILNDNPDILNYCPNCGKLTRTPKARQCRHCGNKWFE